MPELYFEKDDKLNRGHYAHILKELIEHCDEYKREEDYEGYVIALDAPWGTGKSYFLNMFANYLKGCHPDPAKDEEMKMGVITYNAWENDFWNNAFDPLAHSILSLEELADASAGKEKKQGWKKAFKIASIC